ncbi:MAG: BACON domain-containing protein [Methylococcaceae bacterium]
MRILLLLLGVSASLLLRAQVSMTVANNAGNLSAIITSEQLSTVTDLTITGTIDANDIATINNLMPALKTLDISNTTLSPCFIPSVDNFVADWFPGPSLSRNSLNYGGLMKPLLTSVQLPSTLQILGSSAFEYSGITSVTIPATVTSIGWSAFARTPLTSVTIPSTVSYMDQWIFDGCIELKEVVIDAALTGIPLGTFGGCSSLNSVNIPPTVTNIGMSAFINCRSLKTIILPPSVSFIEMTAFYGCTGLTSIYSNNPIPPQTQSSFGEVDKTNCTLYVPFGAAELYAAAPEWGEFTQIVEGPGLSLSSNTVNLGPENNSSATIRLHTTASWTITNNQEWLSISPASGNKNETITFTAQANPLYTSRTSIVTVSTNDGYTETVTVTQQGKANTAPVANAGNDQTVDEGAMVQLDGSASSDADGNELTYLWTAPEGISLSANNVAKPTFTAPQVDTNTAYTFSLVVNDGTVNSPENHVIITIANKLELSVSSHTVSVGAEANLSASVQLLSNSSWSASSDQNWLTVNPISGNGNQQLTFTAQANPLLTSRSAVVTVSSAQLSEIVTVTQSGKTNTAPVANAGNDQTVDEGAMVQLDGSASSDADGNELTYLWTAPEGISLSADNVAKPTFTAPQVDTNTDYTFTLVVNDGTVNSPENHVIITIANKLELSVSEKSVTIGAENNSLATVNVHCNSSWNASCHHDWLTITPGTYNGDQTLTFTAQANPSKIIRTAEVIVSATEGLTETITITQQARPNTTPVANAGSDRSFFGGDIVQLDGSASADIDNDALTYLWTAPLGITLSSATDPRPTFTAPQVEVGTTYSFYLTVNDGQVNSATDEVIITITKKIIELNLSVTGVKFDGKESTARIILSGNAQWTAASDQSWLTVSPTSGTGDKMLVITALSNNTNLERIGTITVSAPGVDSKTLVVTQNGLFVGIEEMQADAQIKYYPNPIVSEMIIEIVNTKHQSISVDIYSLTGQRLRNLANQRNDENISLVWNGTNELGQKVPYGMYILKINNEAKQVVFKGR